MMRGNGWGITKGRHSVDPKLSSIIPQPKRFVAVYRPIRLMVIDKTVEYVCNMDLISV